MVNFNKLMQAKLKCPKCFDPLMWHIEKHVYVCVGCNSDQEVVTKKSLA